MLNRVDEALVEKSEVEVALVIVALRATKFPTATSAKVEEAVAKMFATLR